MESFGSGIQINPDQEVTELDSLCTNCHEQGRTRLLLCSVPFFKEIVLMSFSCEQCGYSNNDIQSAANLAEQGIKLTCRVNEASQLDRQLIKSEWATITIPEINLEIPPQTQQGTLNTIEGMLRKTKDDLSIKTFS